MKGRDSEKLGDVFLPVPRTYLASGSPTLYLQFLSPFPGNLISRNADVRNCTNLMQILKSNAKILIKNKYIGRLLICLVACLLSDIWMLQWIHLPLCLAFTCLLSLSLLLLLIFICWRFSQGFLNFLKIDKIKACILCIEKTLAIKNATLKTNKNWARFLGTLGGQK